MGEIADDLIAAKMRYPHLDDQDAYDCYLGELVDMADQDQQDRSPPRRSRKKTRSQQQQTRQRQHGQTLPVTSKPVKPPKPGLRRVALRVLVDVPVGISNNQTSQAIQQAVTDYIADPTSDRDDPLARSFVLQRVSFL